MKKFLIIPDVHVPYEDRSAWKLLLKAGKFFKPDTIVTLGDFVDMYAVSAHDKDPNRVRSLQEELDYAKEKLDELDELDASHKVFLAGNHEDRLSRYLMQKAPELFNTIRIEELLDLKKRGWTYVKYKDYYRIGKLNFTHDTGKSGPNAVGAALNDFQSNVVIGHIHRIGVVYGGDARGHSHVAISPGWLGDVKAVDYMHRVKANRDWHLGFATGYMDSEGVIHVQAIPIINYKCVLEGKLIQL